MLQSDRRQAGRGRGCSVPDRGHAGLWGALGAAPRLRGPAEPDLRADRVALGGDRGGGALGAHGHGHRAGPERAGYRERWQLGRRPKRGAHPSHRAGVEGGPASEDSGLAWHSPCAMLHLFIYLFFPYGVRIFRIKMPGTHTSVRQNVHATSVAGMEGGTGTQPHLGTAAHGTLPAPTRRSI